MKKLFSLYLLIFAIVTWKSCRVIGSNVKRAEFDYFVLAFQWPATYCNTEGVTGCIGQPNLWTIHGLWPSKYDESPVRNCTNVPFDLKSIPETTRTEMKKLWPDLTGNYFSFWAYQWKQHGTCADVSGTRTVPEYFEKTIDLALNMNISKILEKCHIKPGPWYPNIALTNIEKCLKEETKYQPLIKCKGKEKKGSKVYLWEIRPCFAKNFSGMNCRSGRSNCSLSVSYPKQVRNFLETSGGASLDRTSLDQTSQGWTLALIALVCCLSILTVLTGQMLCRRKNKFYQKI